MSKFIFTFDVEIVRKLRKTMNEHVNILFSKKDNFKNNKFSYSSWSRMCAIANRIEDTLMYINDTPIGDRGLKVAFDFYEFINNVYVVIECIKAIAYIFKVDYEKIEKSTYSFNKDFFDYEYFSYIRSVCSVHPTETTKHKKTIMKDQNLNCCPWVVWTKEIAPYDNNSDLTVLIYGDSGKDYYFWEQLQVSSFENYLIKWIDLISDIIVAMQNYCSDQRNKLCETHVKRRNEFYDDNAFLLYLKGEKKLRFDDEQDFIIFDWYEKVLKFSPSNQKNISVLEKYKNAIMYSLEFICNGLQNMSTTGFENTGIKCDAGFETDLFTELYYPHVDIDNVLECLGLKELYSLENNSSSLDKIHVRGLLDDKKQFINKYVHFINDESDEETIILVKLAMYFNALESDSLLNKSIPNDLKYRIVLLSNEDYNKLLNSKKKMNKSTERHFDKLFD